MLLARSHCWFRVVVRAEENVLGQLPSIEECRLNPVEANAKIAVAAKPMGIDPSALTLLNDSHALRGDVKCCQGQNETQSGEVTDRANF